MLVHFFTMLFCCLALSTMQAHPIKVAACGGARGSDALKTIMVSSSTTIQELRTMLGAKELYGASQKLDDNKCISDYADYFYRDNLSEETFDVEVPTSIITVLRAACQLL